MTDTDLEAEFRQDGELAHRALAEATLINHDLALDVAEALELLRSMRLPEKHAERRCLHCWSWNPPLTEWCLYCSTHIRRGAR